MAKHTPGPWQTQIDEKGDLLLVAGNGHVYFLGNVEDTCGECHANAQLMAAAPKLLELCILLLKQVDQIDIYRHMNQDNPVRVEAGRLIKELKGETESD